MTWKKMKVEPAHDDDLIPWRQRVAAHEAGHAVLAWASPYVAEVGYVNMELKRFWPDQILLAGLTAYAVPVAAAEDPRHFWNQIVISLGGMAGEAFMLNSIKSLGCAIDLESALGYAGIISRRRGDSKADPDWFPWPDARPADGQTLDLGEMFSAPIDPAARTILNACYRRARIGVALYPDKLSAVMTALLSYDRLENDLLQRLLGPRWLWC